MATTCKLIGKNVLGADAASVEFTSIPATYTDLLLVYSARSAISDTYDDFKILFNTSTTGYSSRLLYGYNTIAASGSFSEILGLMASGNTATASTFGTGEIYIPNYAGSTNKSVSLTSCSENNSATMVFMYAAAGLWSNTAAIDRIVIDDYSGGSNIKSGSSFFLYGITKA